MSERTGKKQRRVVALSQADKEIAASGEAVAWDAVSVRKIKMKPENKPNLTPRDQQMVNEVPPHW